jgi:predicted nucleotidyltransferase
MQILFPILLTKVIRADIINRPTSCRENSWFSKPNSTMNMCWHDLRTINELAASFAKREGVEALVLAGSAATGLADEGSDYDLYAYTRETVPVEFRAQLLKPRAARLELHNTFWEWSDEWVEPDGTPFDLMYRSCDAIEADVEAKLGRGEATVGYSTCLCHSVLQATPVFDRRA